MAQGPESGFYDSETISLSANGIMSTWSPDAAASSLTMSRTMNILYHHGTRVQPTAKAHTDTMRRRNPLTGRFVRRQTSEPSSTRSPSLPSLPDYETPPPPYRSPSLPSLPDHESPPPVRSPSLPRLPDHEPTPGRSPSLPDYQPSPGRRDPLTRTPVTPLATVWSSIQNAVGYIYGYPRNSAPASPTLNGPAYGREDRWMTLRTAEGRRRLESVINDWLMMASNYNEGLAQLIARIAQEHGESPEVTDQRFRLRYLGVERIRDLQSQDLANRIAQMLVDELDLPGQRYITALQSWQEIVRGAGNNAGSQPPLDSEVDDDLVKRVQSFIQAHGFRIFLQCLNRTHRGDTGFLFPGFFLQGPDDLNHYGLRTAVWQPNDDVEEISHFIAGLLQGIRPLEPFTAGTRLAPGSRPEYDEEADDSPEAGEYDAEQSRGVRYSLQAIRDLIAEPGVTWRQVFHVYQRHILLYGMHDLVFDADTTLPRGLSELLRTRPEDVAHDMARLNHRFNLEDGVAAMLADAAIARLRETTASWPPLRGGGRGRRRASSNGRIDPGGEDENIPTGGDDGRPHHDGEEELVSLVRDPETRSGGSPRGVPVGSPVYPRGYWGRPSHAGGDDRSGPNAGNNLGAQQHEGNHGANSPPSSPPIRSDRDTQMTRYWRDYAACCVEVETEAREERRTGAQSRQQWLQSEIDRLDRNLGRRRGPRLTQDELEARFAEVLARAVVASWDTAYDRMRTREQEGLFGEDAGQSHGSDDDDDDDDGPPPPPSNGSDGRVTPANPPPPNQGHSGDIDDNDRSQPSTSRSSSTGAPQSSSSPFNSNDSDDSSPPLPAGTGPMVRIPRATIPAGTYAPPDPPRGSSESSSEPPPIVTPTPAPRRNERLVGPPGALTMTRPRGRAAPRDAPARRRRSSSIVARHRQQMEAAASAGVGAVGAGPATARKRGSAGEERGGVGKRAKK
ncbi:hypothetical protein LTR91_003812 [Friedmanniomyces endolithicus]|uniref:Uncharacterized protein n=1 Tax=Friedmanniomyces endolithicus TaxID=329885 RepID=A0AAN6KW94_9PEZI|nr:hypothetical protein LTR57_003542 [Friedmanniomyces endolithicus]KAK0986396.1 hypothetical protein LTS01_009921 [Friedmanniomyces endolithicus]KAK1005887.1 hypothetical protein LTR91_003812 [Friedmanniomyces endolithicus]KAK1043980.1 hypothetical protein LTS16_007571 [Friedmanniomyces endolithicus]